MAAQPFEGVRVLDLSSVWAAPYAVQLLAGNGADVIKVEHVTRPDFRLFAPSQMMRRANGTGKGRVRSISSIGTSLA